MSKTYTIKDLIGLFLSKIWLILLLMIVCGAAAFSFSNFIMPLKYQSYVSMYVKNSNESNNTDGVNLNDLNASKSLLSTYIAVLQDDAVMEEIGKALLEKHSIDDLGKVFSVNKEENTISINSIRNCLAMSAVNETEVLKVTAVTTNADISADLCNIISDIAPAFLIRVVGAGSVEAIGEAKPNYIPVSPDVPKYTILGIIAGAMLAVIIILIADFFDNTVKSSRDLSEKYDKSILGEIQCFKKSKDKKNSNNSTDLKSSLILEKNTPFYINESYKAMRNNIVFALSTSEKKIFAVTSAEPGDGKSTTSANIAITLAQASYKVLLIDADMRKPIQHKFFKIKNQNGLSSVIGKMKTLNESIHKNVTENLDIISSGPKPPNPSELLASEQAEKMLTELSEKYDYIIIDTPPVNVVSDVMGLSSSVAGIVMVLKYGKTSYDAVEKVIKKTELSKTNLLGFVLNNINTKHRGGLYYNYRSDSYSEYGYGEESSKENNKNSDNKKEKNKNKDNK